MIRILFVIILITLTSQLFSQPFNSEEKKILEAQDKRDADAIIKMIEEDEIEDSKLIEKALISLANIADTNSCSVIMKIYNESNDIHIKSAVAFALGQIPSAAAIKFLRMMEQKEATQHAYKRIAIYKNILNALGKIGTEENLKRICKLEFTNDSLNGAIALSIARFGMRKIKSKDAFERLKKLTYSINDENQKKWVTYAFNRIGDKEYLKDYKKELELLAASSNVYCRMWAFSAMGKTADISYPEYIMAKYPAESDWRIRVNMLNAVGNLSPDESSLSENYFDMILHSAVDDANPNVSVAACQNLARICNKLAKDHAYSIKLKEYFENYLKPDRAIEPAVMNEVIVTLAKIFKDDYRTKLFQLFSQEEGYDTKAAIVAAFQYMEKPMVYKELRDSISTDIQMYNLIHPNNDGSMIGSPELAKVYRAFVETLAALDDKLDDENKNTTRLIFSEFASSKNTAITDISLTALTDSMYSKYWNETGQIMTFDFENFEEPKDKDVMIMYINAWGTLKTESAIDILKKQLNSNDYEIAKASADALKQITGKDYIKNIEVSKITTDFDWKFINNLDNKKIATLLTNRGNIKIELFPNIAPFTVQSFIKLGEKGFYNGTVFHRLVPNFVIQGGDPLGTGYGGPGYSIRTEIAYNTYDSYYVGMASSGKDTEGSQFFITQSPQPHLDGKYTIFGKIKAGFEVVDKIQIGDKIAGIVFSDN
ncbi:MAG TPA: peptidylprolyl isomerase [Ignavibacteria bacterium]|jgi:peptidylprolyl isomerase